MPTPKKSIELEFHSTAANSHKFYRAEYWENDRALLTWGRIGTTGPSQERTHAEADAKVREKQSKGYKVVNSHGGAWDFPTKKGSGKPAAAVAPLKTKPAAVSNGWLDELDQIAKAK